MRLKFNNNPTTQPGSQATSINNTFEWITSGAGFAMGPSRVNPTNGQILDADVIFDADFLQFWKQEYETFTPKGIEMFTGGANTMEAYRKQVKGNPLLSRHRHGPLCGCNLLHGKSHELALSRAVMASRTQNPEDFNKLVMQALKDTTMHEIGHTLGLRHNFIASTFYSIEEANDVEKTSKTGTTASVMDYTPVNMVPKDATQGDYYMTTIGPYDHWAIEYGYKVISGSESEELKKIASRSGEKGLAFATDENTRGIDPDPRTNRWDFGNDAIAYAKSQQKLVAETWPDIIEKLTEDGEGYQKPRRAFGVLLGTQGRAMFFVSRYVGGMYVSRSHKGDKDGEPPFTVVPAKKQRQAMDLLEKEVFGDKPYQFPPEFYNKLAASNWNHWGTSYLTRSDYPVHRVILMWQDRVLDQLLSPLTLTRLHDSELKIAADKDAFTTAELLNRLTKAIFSEVDTIKGGDYSNRKPAISSIRRNLQRSFLAKFSSIAKGNTSAPADCKSIALSELKSLKTRIDELLKKNSDLDQYTRAHLEEASAHIEKVLEAQIIKLQF